MSHASFDSSLPRINADQSLHPPLSPPNTKPLKKGTISSAQIPNLETEQSNLLTNRATKLSEARTAPNSGYEEHIDALIHEIFTNKKEKLAAILAQSQIETTMEADGDPLIIIGDPKAFKQCIADLAIQLESKTHVKTDQTIKRHIKEKFLQEAMPILKWQKQLRELDTSQETLKLEVQTLTFSGKQRKKITKELKETIRTTNLFLHEFGSLERRTTLPELPQMWTADHLLAKNQLLHSRLVQTDAPSPSLKDIKREYKAVQDLLNEIQGGSKASVGEHSGWLNSLAGWFASGIRRPQTEKDASDFAFMEHNHARIDDLHSRMTLLADKFDKLDLSEADAFTLEFRALQGKIEDYHAHMEFRIDYFTHEAALEATMMDLTDQKSELMSGNMDFSSKPLANFRQAVEDFGQMIERHRKKQTNPKIIHEIEKKLEFQTQLIQDKVEHFLEQFEAEMEAEFHESCAQIQAREENKEKELYCLSALHKECSVFIEEIDEFMEDFKHYFNVQDIPSIITLTNLAAHMDQAIEVLKGKKTSEVNQAKLIEIRSQRKIITLDKQKRKWQKEHFEKMEALEKPLSLVQTLFSTHTAKNAALFYLMQVTPYAKSLAETSESTVVREAPVTPKEPPPPQPHTLQAKVVHLDDPSPEPATSSANAVDQAFWMTWPETASKLLSSFSVEEGPLKQTTTQNLSETLADTTKKLEILQSQVAALGDSFPQRNESLKREFDECEKKLNDTRSSTPSVTSPIPDTMEFIRKVEAADQTVEDLQEKVEQQTPSIKMDDIHAEDALKRTSLHLALEKHDIEAAKRLVRKGADIFKKDLSSITPLHLAVLSKDSELLQLMLDQCSKEGISLDIENDQGFTPLHLAIESKNEEAVKLLLNTGADPLRTSILNHRVPIFDALKPERINLLKSILDHLPKTTNLDKQYYLATSLLTFALKEDNLEAIKQLIHHGSSPFKISYHGTIFHSAVLQNKTNIVKMLIEMGFNSNDFKNSMNETPLFVAVRENNREMVELLLNAGANPNHRNVEGETPISIASKKENEPLVSLLAHAGGDSRLAVLDNRMIQLLSHSWELAGTTKIKGQEFKLEGSLAHFLSPYMLQTINSFAQSHPDVISEDQRKLIEVALAPIEQMGKTKDPTLKAQKIMEAIRANQPVFIPTGWPGHSIEIVIMDSYLMICNRGEGSEKPIDIFKIDPSSIDSEFLQKLSWKSMDDFTRSIPLILSQINAQKDPNCFLLEKFNPLRRWQRVGNCAWESLETAIFGSLTLKELLAHPENNPQTTITTTLHTHEAWLQYAKLDYLERYLLLYPDDQRDINLLNAIYDLGLREPAEIRFDELILTVLNQLNLNPCQYNAELTQYVCKNVILFNPPFTPMFPLEQEFHNKFETFKPERGLVDPTAYSNVVMAISAISLMIFAGFYSHRMGKE